jgi:aminoglycoside phosphotransferase (APT) family kinase protein
VLPRRALWLATLHQAKLTLDRVLDVGHEADNARRWAEVVAEQCPESADAVRRLAAALAADPPAPFATPVPIHKDFHHRHVIVGGRVGVVDFDEARMGDPAFDLAHFGANLELLTLRSAAAGDESAQWWPTFRAAYGRVTGWTDDGRLPWFTAYACVKIAKQLVTGRGPGAPARGGDVAHVLEVGRMAVDA